MMTRPCIVMRLGEGEYWVILDGVPLTLSGEGRQVVMTEGDMIGWGDSGVEAGRNEWGRLCLLGNAEVLSQIAMKGE